MSDTRTLPEIGQKVIALYVPGATQYNGQTVTVSRTATERDGYPEPRAWAEDFQDIAVDGEFQNFYFTEWKVIEDTDDSNAEDPAKDSLVNEIAELKAQLVRSGERLTTEQRKFSLTMQIVQDQLTYQKDEQNWCDDGYNAAIERLNDELGGDWTFDTTRSLIQEAVDIQGTTSCSINVWVYSDEDSSDPDNWKGSDGHSIDSDDAMQERLRNELDNCGGFDDVEVQ